MTFTPCSQRDLVHLMENRERLSLADFRSLLDEIADLQDSGWEMGPDPNDPSTTVLAFSIFAHETVLARITNQFALPISGNGWRVRAGIPPRDWERYFEYPTHSGTRYRVEGADWRYRVRAEGGMAKIILYPPRDNSDSFDELAHVLCVGELGEDNLADFVSGIECDPLDPSAGRPFCGLRGEFASLFKGCHYREFFVREQGRHVRPS